MDTRPLDLNLLKVFDCLMESRSVTAAAQKLALTQSTVSAALARLRVATGDRLIERHGNAMVPTRTALAVWPDIRSALQAIEVSLARLDAFEPARYTGTFRIGFDEYAFIVLGALLLRSMRSAAPQVQVEILPIRAPTSDEALNEGTVDMVIGASWTPLHGLRVDRLFSEEFVCLVDVDHPTIGNAPPIETYLAAPHLLVSSIGQVPGNVDAALARKGLQRRIGATVPYLLAAPQLLAGSDMVFNAGRRLANRLAAWYAVKIAEPPIRIPGFAVAMVWHPRNTGSRAHQWLRNAVLTAAQNVD